MTLPIASGVLRTTVDEDRLRDAVARLVANGYAAGEICQLVLEVLRLDARSLALEAARSRKAIALDDR